jgi:hypothetical protein
MSTESAPNRCVLSSEIVDGDALATRLGEAEGARALERCMNRIGRVVESHRGGLLRAAASGVTVAFDRCDAAVLAACEMLERVESLPPTSGVRLTVRVGLHYGPVGEDASEVGGAAGDAHRLMALASPGEVLASAPVAVQLSQSTKQAVGQGVLRNQLGQGLEWPVYAFGGSAAVAAPVAARSSLSQRLEVRHQQDSHVIEDHRPILLIGRELGNDVVIIDARASRQHARIERRRDGFVLVDQSTNGTYVAVEGQPERCIKHGEAVLVGQGRIGCGFSVDEVERDLVFFAVL